jgi:DNA polymerase III delta prime subunit
MKFVILDEVDYMTKNAQQALRYLLQNYSNSVRFCLICNYISRIDEGLQNEFLRLRFNQLPEQDIINFLNHISTSEKLNISLKSLQLIQRLYKSDIRSMINFIQANQNISEDQFNIIDDSVWEQLYKQIIKTKVTDKEDLKIIIYTITEISIKYNIDKKNIIKDFLNYIIRNFSNSKGVSKNSKLNKDFFAFVENIMHNEDCKNTYYINYSLISLIKLLS